MSVKRNVTVPEAPPSRREPTPLSPRAGSRKNRERGSTTSAPAALAAAALCFVDVRAEAHQPRADGAAARTAATSRPNSREIDDHDVGAGARVDVANELDIGHRRADLRPVHEVADERADAHRLRGRVRAWAAAAERGRARPPRTRANACATSATACASSAIASGSSSPGRTWITPSASMRSMSSRPASVRTIVSVQSLNLPMPPVEMSACSAAKSGHILQPSRVHWWHSFSGTSW